MAVLSNAIVNPAAKVLRRISPPDVSDFLMRSLRL
jgi:hypothetical protein